LATVRIKRCWLPGRDLNGEKILWIEDDAKELAPLLWPLEDEEYEINVATDAVQAIDLLNKDTYDLILLDILLPTGQKDPSKYIEFYGRNAGRVYQRT